MAPEIERGPGRGPKPHFEGWRKGGTGLPDLWVKIISEELYPPGAIAKQKAVEKLLREEVFEGKKVLDIGCGTGRFGLIAKEKGAEVVGIDVAEKMLKETAQKFPVTAADGAKLPLDNEAFDHVFSFMVLMVIPNYEQAIAEINRVLKPGGKLFWSIVHPHSEKWDSKTKLCYQDESNYTQEEKRPWIFHLKDGRTMMQPYTHRPLEAYHTAFRENGFKIIKVREPRLPEEYFQSGKYARNEYYLCKARKKEK